VNLCPASIVDLFFSIERVLEGPVIKKTVLLIFAVMILQGAMSTGIAAQTNNACLSITTWSFPDPMPVPRQNQESV